MIVSTTIGLITTEVLKSRNIRLGRPKTTKSVREAIVMGLSQVDRIKPQAASKRSRCK
jgi:hypothetical protein